MKTYTKLYNTVHICIHIGAPVPENFQAVPSEREVTFSWSAPSVSTPINGSVYTLSCTPPPSSSSLPSSFTTPGTYTLTGFYPDTLYECSLATYYVGITSPPATVVFSTSKDCELIV